MYVQSNSSTPAFELPDLGVFPTPLYGVVKQLLPSIFRYTTSEHLLRLWNSYLIIIHRCHYTDSSPKPPLATQSDSGGFDGLEINGLESEAFISMGFAYKRELDSHVIR